MIDLNLNETYYLSDDGNLCKLDFGNREIIIEGCIFNLTPKPKPKFNLSSKVRPSLKYYYDPNQRLYDEKHVKLFIKLIKKDLDKATAHWSDYNTEWIKDVITKRAGVRFK